MKYPFIAAASLLLLLSACQHQSPTTASQPAATPPPQTAQTSQPADSTAIAATDSATEKPDFTALNAVLRSMRPESSAYIVSGMAPQTITGDKGIRVRIVPADLETADGQPVSGPIEVSMTEMTNAADFILNGAPTMSDGKLLVSGGAVDLRCTAGGKALQIKDGRTMEIAFPRSKPEPDMTTFYGRRNEMGMVNWKPSERPAPADNNDTGTVEWMEERIKMRDTVQLAGKYEGRRGQWVGAGTLRGMNALSVDMIDGQPRLMAHRKYATTDTDYVRRQGTASERMVSEAYNVLQISQLGFINCDRFSQQQMTDLMVNVAAGQAEGTGLAYVIFKDINSVIQTTVLLQPAAGNAIRLPQNTTARLVVFRTLGKKLYGFSQEINTATDKRVEVLFQPIANADMRQMIAGKS